MARIAFLVLAFAALASVARSQVCPISPTATPLDFSRVSVACGELRRCRSCSDGRLGPSWNAQPPAALVPLPILTPDAGTPSSQDYCSSCLCALVTAYLPAFQAAQITLDPENPQAFPIDAAASVITSCTQAYYTRQAD